MRAMKEVRVALIVVINAMTSNYMGGMGLYKDSFKGSST